MLHTSASSLTSDSSSSLRRSRLGGIAEDAEEGSTAPVGKGRNLTTPERLEAIDIRSSKNEKVHTSVAPAVMESLLPSQERGRAPGQTDTLPRRVDSLPPTEVASSTVLQGNKSSVQSPQNAESSAQPPPNEAPPAYPPPDERSTSPDLSFNKPLPAPPEATPPRKPLDVQLSHHDETNLDYRSRQSQDTTRPSFDRRQSSQTVRPQADDAASQYSGYSAYKPKKKLGPRPHKEPEGRPKTSGAASKDQRAVANLPTNLRISSRVPATVVARPGSQQSSRSVPSNFRHRNELLSAAPPPPLPQPASQIVELYKPADAGPFISATALNPQRGPSATPEKLRLMKALQLRKKQQALAKRSSMVSPALDVDVHTSGIPALGEGQIGDEKPTEPVETHTSPIESGLNEQHIGTDQECTLLSDKNTAILSPAPSLAENDGPKQYLVVTNGIIAEVLLKEPPIKKDSGISSLADVETPVHDPFVGPLADHSTKVQKRIDADETQRTRFEAVSHETNANSKFGESKSHPVTPPHSPPPAMIAPQDQVQSTRNQADLAKDVEASRSLSDVSQADTPDLHKKRRTLMEPIKVLSSPEASDMSDEDSFVEELQHAKLEQAKPISVARSPITPIFKNSSDRLGEVTRATSAPMQINKIDGTASTVEKPRSIGGRSASTALPSLPPMTGESGYALAAKKGTVSSGITTRIKALESFSRREASGSPPQTPQSQPISQKSSPSLWSFKKRTSLAQIKSNLPNISTSKIGPRQLPTPQPTPTPEQIPSSPPRPWLQRTGSAAQIDVPMQKGDSISVTARIIRDPKRNSTEPADHPSEPVSMNLHRSPLTVEHERSEPQSQSAMSSAASTIRPDSRPTSPKVDRPRFSFSSTRSSVAKLATSDSMASRMSQVSSHNKKSSGNLPLSPSDATSIADERTKESRASRLMKRMSNLTGGSRRNLFTSLSPNGRGQMPPAPIAEHRESLTEQSSLSDSVSHVVDIGDVNVQFPDTLLWKRRFMRIDDQGYLVLTPPTKETMERNRGISRRFHLSEFKKPALPDPEREELPWSILLDFEDGTCLQCACESRYAQIQVLRSECNDGSICFVDRC